MESNHKLITMLKYAWLYFSCYLYKTIYLPMIEYKMCRQIMKKMYGYLNIMKKVGKKQKGNAIQC